MNLSVLASGQHFQRKDVELIEMGTMIFDINRLITALGLIRHAIKLPKNKVLNLPKDKGLLESSKSHIRDLDVTNWVSADVGIWYEIEEKSSRTISYIFFINDEDYIQITLLPELDEVTVKSNLNPIVLSENTPLLMQFIAMEEIGKLSETLNSINYLIGEKYEDLRRYVKIGTHGTTDLNNVFQSELTTWGILENNTTFSLVSTVKNVSVICTKAAASFDPKIITVDFNKLTSAEVEKIYFETKALRTKVENKDWQIEGEELSSPPDVITIEPTTDRQALLQLINNLKDHLGEMTDSDLATYGGSTILVNDVVGIFAEIRAIEKRNHANQKFTEGRNYRLTRGLDEREASFETDDLEDLTEYLHGNHERRESRYQHRHQHLERRRR